MSLTEYVKKGTASEAVVSSEATTLNGIPTDDGMALFYHHNNPGVKFQLDRMCSRLNIATSDADVTTAKSTVEDFSTVFSQWQRVAILGTQPRDPNHPEELNNWTYTAATDSIVGTINTATTVGFISQRTIPGDYQFEVEISSTNGDDDYIGVFLGYVEVNGVTHTLSAIRTAGANGVQGNPGSNYLWGLYLDFQGFNNLNENAIQVALAQGNYDLLYPDGNLYSTPPAGSVGGWNNYKTMGAIKIRASLVGSVITVETCNPGAAYSTAAKITFDLNSREDTKRFLGGTKIGYAAMSQPECTWRSIQRPGAYADYVDARTKTGYAYNGTSWVAIPASPDSGYVKPGRHYFSPMNNTLYFYNPATGNLDAIASVSYDFATDQQVIDGTAGNLLVSPKGLRALYDANKT